MQGNRILVYLCLDAGSIIVLIYNADQTISLQRNHKTRNIIIPFINRPTVGQGRIMPNTRIKANVIINWI